MEFLGFECKVRSLKYSNDRTALELVDPETGERVTVASVNLPGEPMGPDEVAIKDYSENEGLLEVLIAEKVVEPPHREVSSGFVDIPICRLAQ